jgi:hypothetical protein
VVQGIDHQALPSSFNLLPAIFNPFIFKELS